MPPNRNRVYVIAYRDHRTKVGTVGPWAIVDPVQTRPLAQGPTDFSTVVPVGNNVDPVSIGWELIVQYR